MIYPESQHLFWSEYGFVGMELRFEGIGMGIKDGGRNDLSL